MKHTHKYLGIPIILALVLASMPVKSAGAAGVRYAAENGTGDCSSWENACTLQSALSGATSGDEIWAMAGTHKPTSGTDRTATFQLKSGVAVYGGFNGTESKRGDRNPAANLTILSGDLNGDDGANFANNGENSYHVVIGSGTSSSAILDGFTIRGGNANGSSPDHSGGGMYNLGGSPSLTNVSFSGNQAIDGGGMTNDASSPSLTKVTFSGNQATNGGGMGNWSKSSPSLTNVTLSDNQATTGGGMYNWSNSSPSLTKVTLSGNQATTGGGMYNENSSPNLTNVTLSGNTATGYGGGMFNSSSSPNLTNVTLSENHAGWWGGGMFNVSSSSPSLTNVIIANSASGGDCVNFDISSQIAASANNLIENATYACGLEDGVGGNIIGSDPNLAPLESYGGWTETQALQPGSPAIDAGTNSGCPGTDQRGITRPQGSQCDIGAYEHYTGIYHAKPTASGAGNCSSWADACRLQTALDTVVSGDEIWVKAGTHKPTSGSERTATFQLVSGVGAYGGFAGTEIARDQRDPAANPTILSGDLNGDDGADFANNDENSYHVVTGSGTDSSAILDGFTVTGGNANGSSPNHSGGGMYNVEGSPSLTNVTLSGNKAIDGGGMTNDASSPSLTNVTLSGNQATNGGGMGNWDSSPSLMYVTLSDNQATNGGGMYNQNSSSPSLMYVTLSDNQTSGHGGGMYNQNSSSPSLMYVTLSGNHAYTWQSQECSGGGMYNYYSSPSLTNVTFSGNSACGGGGGMYNVGGSPILTNVTFSGNSAHFQSGGGMGNWGSPSLMNVTFSGNFTDLGSGGGMYNAGHASLTNVTFSANWAGTDYLGQLQGGGMLNSGGSPILTNVIIADSLSGGDCVKGLSWNSLDPTSANNLIEDADNACGLENGEGGNIIGTDPKLRPLGNYGGWTETQALQPGSPAIDAGKNSGCPVTDQRGVTRPQGSQCDIGAYEHYTGIYHAKPTASGAGNCSSWADACRLQIALGTVVSGDEIWAMAGTHNPTTSDPDPRKATFQLVSGVGAYGGFAGTETSRDERDPAANPTILSGDLSGNDVDVFTNNGENSYHVVTGSGTDSSAILDGFTVTGGNASGISPNDSGGGMYNLGGSPSLTNVTLSRNWAIDGGGMTNDASSPSLTNVTLTGNQATNGAGMYNEDSSPSLTNVTLSSNNAGWYGGGMYNHDSNPSLTNVTLSGNQAYSTGGGMFNDGGSPSLTNVTLSGNSAFDNGGGMYNYSSNPSLTNVIIANSDSGGDCVNYGLSSLDASTNNLIEDAANACGLADGVNWNIIGADPMLSPLAYYGGWTKTQALQPGSPAIDTGTDSGCPSTDQRGKPRPDDGDLNGTATCDIGAVEFQRAPMTTRLRSQMKYDGWVLESGEFSGKGGTKNNLGTVLQVGDDPADKQYRSILSFGTASIPDWAVITKVILKVKKAGVTGSNPMSTHNSLVVDIKKGKFSTLPTLQINDFQAKPGKLKAGKFPTTLYSGWYRSALFKGAHAYINVKGNTQLRLRFTLDDNNDNGADILKLYSGNAILANRPQLIVEYYVP